MEVSTATISACTAKSLNDELVAVEDSIDMGNVLWIFYDCLCWSTVLILADIDNCTNPQPYWLAWGPSCLRFGRGLDPTRNELTGMCQVSPNTQTDFYVRIASDYGSSANWTLYRQNEVNFNGKWKKIHLKRRYWIMTNNSFLGGWTEFAFISQT